MSLLHNIFCFPLFYCFYIRHSSLRTYGTECFNRNTKARLLLNYISKMGSSCKCFFDFIIIKSINFLDKLLMILHIYNYYGS